MTARIHSALLGVIAEAGSDGAIRLCASDHPPCALSAPSQQDPVSVTIWGEAHLAAPLGAEADAWVSALIGTPCRLVYMPDTLRRPVKPGVGQPDDIVSFADGFPLLLTNQSSLDDLNERIVTPIPMTRFRPNLVVTGAPAFDELNWRRVRIGDLEFEVTGPCERCILTTRDPDTGVKDEHGEPLKTLATYQTNDKGTIFGMNLIPRGTGTLEVGQQVEVLARS